MNTQRSAAEIDELKEIFLTLPMCLDIGLSIERLIVGETILRLNYQKKLVGNPETGHLHGGAITTLMDTAGGLAAMSMVPADMTIATLDLRIDYLKPATPGKATLGYARCYKCTSSIAFVNGVAYHDSPDDPIANCTATFMIGSVGFSSQGANKDAD